MEILTHMTLDEVINVVNAPVIEGGPETQVDCFGKNVGYTLFGNRYGETSVTYDTMTLEVYQISVYDNLSGKAFTNFSHNIKKAYFEEAKRKDWEDESSWVTTDCPDDMLEKIKAIMTGRKYSTDVVVIFDGFTEEDLEMMKEQAFQRKMSLDEYFAELLMEAIKIAEEITSEDSHGPSVPPEDEELGLFGEPYLSRYYGAT